MILILILILINCKNVNKCETIGENINVFVIVFISLLFIKTVKIIISIISQTRMRTNALNIKDRRNVQIINDTQARTCIYIIK